MCYNEFIPVSFALPNVAAITVDGIGNASLPVSLTPIDFCNEYPSYWLEKNQLTGETMIVGVIKAYTKKPWLVVNGNNVFGEAFIGGRPIRRPNTY